MWDPEFALEKEILTDPYRSIQIHTRFWDPASEPIVSSFSFPRTLLICEASRRPDASGAHFVALRGPPAAVSIVLAQFSNYQLSIQSYLEG